LGKKKKIAKGRKAGRASKNESKCETIHMRMSSAYRFIFMQIKLIFIRNVLHEDSF